MDANKIIDTENLSVDTSNPGTEPAIQNPDAASVEYKPQSQVCNTVDTVSPVQLMYEMNKALTEIDRKVGGVDLYVTEKLGYNSFIEVCRAFGAEQVDAIAVAIYNIEQKGQASITGDGTGVGKGRVAAGVARFVRIQGKVPVFITEKPQLFSDFYRDVIAIGSDEGVVYKYLSGEREVTKKVTKKEIREAIEDDIENGNFDLDYNQNKLFKSGYEKETESCIEEYRELYFPSDIRIEPVYKRNSDYEKEHKKAKHKFVPFIVNGRGKNTDVMDANGNIIYQPLDKQSQKEIFESGRLPKGFDCVLLTYSQIRNPLQAKLKADFIRNVVQDSVVILDESHNASGASNTGLFFIGGKNPKTKEETIGILDRAWGAHFLSATFAKRPDNMPIYAKKTAISDAGLNNDELIEGIKVGGVALQEILAADLVSEGQMLRREKSYEGVEVNYVYLDDSMDDPSNNFYNPSFNLKQSHLAISDNVTRLIRAIIKFQADYVDPIIEGMDAKFAKEQSSVEQHDMVREAGINNPPLFSGIFNLINQLLLSINAEAVADWAIMRMKQGKKPVIALANTMESFLDYMQSQMKGDDTISTDFSTVIERRLLGTLRYTRTYPDGSSEKEELNVDDQDADFRDSYYKLMEDIQSTTMGINVSPIDVILKRIEAAGFSVAEVTGRKKYVEFINANRGIIKSRIRPNNTDLFRKFNDNEIDCLIINQSAATGTSAHAFKTRKVNKVNYDASGKAIIPTSLTPSDEVKQRVMVVLQAELNVNTEVQKRGRVNRTAQVFLPIYDYVISAIPASMRYMMMLQKKLKSLDANTTSNAKQSTKVIDVVDFLNAYGDEVVVEYMKHRPEINFITGNILKFTQAGEPTDETISVEDKAHRVSGRVAILSSQMQEDFYANMTDMYNAFVQKKRDDGTYNLEVEYIDLQAKTIEANIVEPPSQEKGSIFSAGVYLEKCECQNLRKPFNKKEVQAQVQASLTLTTEDSDNPIEFTPKEVVEYHLSKYKTIADIRHAREAEDAKLIRDKELKTITSSPAYLMLEDDKARSAFVKEKTDTINQDYESKLKRISIANDNIRTLVENNIKFFYPMRRIEYPLQDFEVTGNRVSGICLGININYNAKNPFAPSAMELRIILANSLKLVRFKLSDSFVSSIKEATREYSGYDMQQSIYSSKALIDNWNEITKESRADKVIKYIVTGNLLKALGNSDYREDGTKLIKFSTNDGRIRKGVLLKDSFNPSKAKAHDIAIPILKATPIILREGNHMYTVKNSSVSIQRYGKYWKIFATKGKSDSIYQDTDFEKHSTYQWEQKRRGADWEITIEGEKNMEAIIGIMDEKYHFKISLPPNVWDAWKDKLGYGDIDIDMQRNEESGSDGTAKILENYNKEYSEYERNRSKEEIQEYVEEAIVQPSNIGLVHLQRDLTKLYLLLDKEAKKRDTAKFAQGGTVKLTELEKKRLRYYLNKYKMDNATIGDKKEIMELVMTYYPKLNFTDWGKKNADYYIKKYEKGNMKDYEYNSFADIILTEFEDAIKH